jgi:hypothetical protein
MRDTHASPRYHRRMTHTDVQETRTLTIVLPEAEWRALRAEEPDAIAWLQAQIRRRLDAGSHGRAYAGAGATAGDEHWGDDY